ncbi:hypothetical protein [Porphyrobacter sp. AAP82]|uniref:hypothetical protein n=1 Tax=Porphyrobacter sp. AAP82 TaxID=1248917 RepID=UPI0004781253|nr:hypothetical protein [Porphyrobacter sp. AAP82]
MSLSQSLYAEVHDRRRIALPLLFPAFGGLWYLWSFGAPAGLIAVNAGALAAALGWIMLGRLPKARRVRIGIALALALALFGPLLTGPDLDGVRRWIAIGPVSLNAGMLLLPLLTMLAARETRAGPAILGLAAAALALQPDAAALAALALAAAVLAAHHRSIGFAAAGIAAGGLAALTFGAGALEPQLHVEGVLAHVAQRSVWKAALLAILLFVVPLWHLVWDPQLARAEGSTRWRRCSPGWGPWRWSPPSPSR